MGVYIDYSLFEIVLSPILYWWFENVTALFNSFIIRNYLNAYELPTRNNEVNLYFLFKKD